MNCFGRVLMIRLFLFFLLGPLLAAQHQAYPKPMPRWLDPQSASLQGALPPPPPPGSLAAQADLETVLQVQAWRTPEQAALAQRLVQDDPFKFSEVLGPGFSAERLPLTAAFLKQVIADTVAVNLALKDRFQRKRPHLEDPRVEPCLELTGSPAYPSGHSVRAYVTASILSGLFPERREALLNYARKAAWARVQGGIHYPTDLEGGRILALAIVAALQQSGAFRAEQEACKAEIAAWRLKNAG